MSSIRKIVKKRSSFLREQAAVHFGNMLEWHKHNFYGAVPFFYALIFVATLKYIFYDTHLLQVLWYKMAG